MSEHPNVRTINRMTKAIFDEDRATLGEIFTDDLTFHLRGPDQLAADHQGVDGFLGVVGSWVEATNGNIELTQRLCVGEGEWAAEAEHAELHRNGTTLESDNAFVYRFRDGRIAEMWMYLGALPGPAAAFFA